MSGAQVWANKKAASFTGCRFSSSIGISLYQGKKIVFRITIAKIR
ncbi:hypothetical protein HMPREF9136_0646 [Prevotella dentalis DSM 3688]|uniref:Uncharacterized protein n=1 Tax=Prevotella dentalis (strain ATCC 49559 / DSM 3688 / JCM 13448 / NCTC 12043 / ES 2772) TaxID=908937 RepID=F9D1B8_PREDD|nr:hypothetical protein HMPREF9136_0646 [Prevotella dentalis DSM 3688]